MLRRFFTALGMAADDAAPKTDTLKNKEIQHFMVHTLPDRTAYAAFLAEPDSALAFMQRLEQSPGDGHLLLSLMLRNSQTIVTLAPHHAPALFGMVERAGYEVHRALLCSHECVRAFIQNGMTDEVIALHHGRTGLGSAPTAMSGVA